MKIRWFVLLVVLVIAALVGAGIGLGQLLLGSGTPTGAAVPTAEDDDLGTVEIYTVADDATLRPGASGLTQEVWDTFVRVATPGFAGEVVSEYQAGDAPDSDTLAFVYQDDDPERWIVAANLATSEDRPSLIATLVHEYAHILTLSTDEVSPDGGSCSTLELDEGCADADSAILGFEEQFWAPYGDDAPALDNVDDDLAYDFYLEHEDDFVSDYAATNAVEDIAETFMTWVVEDAPAGTSTVGDKFDFLEQYPHLVDERERIRAEFAEELGLAQ